MKFIKGIIKVLFVPIWVLLVAVVVTSVSPVYNPHIPTPFRGPDIFNPYRNIDTVTGWKRANFHTHTRVDGIFNECDHTPAQTLEYYNRLGYDIVTFSNHNALTTHPTDSTLQVELLYEHGYNLFKFHKLVFGSKSVMRFDHLLPLFTFQKQFQLELLNKQCDIVVLNHPLRTTTLGKSSSTMSRLTGYQIIELDSGKSVENRYWDSALSAGIYSFGLANDDLHTPDRTKAIAIRSNFISTPSARYTDIRKALLEGCYYSMRTPDYGAGDWQTKIDKNRVIPTIKNIGLCDRSPFITLSQTADSIKVIGQNHSTLAVAYNTDSLAYAMADSDPYCRFTAYFADGEVIYTNPFARYDSRVAQSPFGTTNRGVNILFTILFNVTLLLLLAALVKVAYKTLIKW